MRLLPAVFLTLLAVLGCGSEAEPYDPLTINGYVRLLTWADGGSGVQTIAYVSRPLPDGGSVPLVDAGVALNGVPLGPSDPELLAASGRTWTRPSVQGATYGAQQTLSVVGANPPASVSFTCPVQVVFTAPEQGARLDRSMPVHLEWSAGGSPAWQLVLILGLRQPLENGDVALPFGFSLLAPGTRSFELGFPNDYLSVPLEATASVWLDVPGESSRSDSGCSSMPRLDLIYAPGQPGIPGG